MQPERFTSKLQSALGDAQSLAVGKDHNYIEPVHLLLALLDQQGGSVRPLLVQSGANVNQLRTSVHQMFSDLPQVSSHDGELRFSPNMGKLFNLTDKLAQQRGDQYIASELFVLAMLDDKSGVGKLLSQAGVTKQNLEQAITQMRGGEGVNDPNAEETRNNRQQCHYERTLLCRRYADLCNIYPRGRQRKLKPVHHSGSGRYRYVWRTRDLY